jgi:hypothetical protein
VLFEAVDILPVKRLALTIVSESGPTKPSCNRRFTKLMAGLDGVLHCLRCGRWHTGWPRETRTSSNSCLTVDIALAASASESGKGLLCPLLPEGPSQEGLEEPGCGIPILTYDNRSILPGCDNSRKSFPRKRKKT